MVILSGNSGCGTTLLSGSHNRGLLAAAAIALGAILMTAVSVLEPMPADAQTFVIGGFRIHVHGLGVYSGRHYGRRQASRSTSSRRHGHRRRGHDEDVAEKEKPASTPQAPAGPAAGLGPAATGITPVELPISSVRRPVLHGPDIEPSK
jgi:hypothetical protein